MLDLSAMPVNFRMLCLNTCSALPQSQSVMLYIKQVNFRTSSEGYLNSSLFVIQRKTNGQLPQIFVLTSLSQYLKFLVLALVIRQNSLPYQ